MAPGNPRRSAAPSTASIAECSPPRPGAEPARAPGGAPGRSYTASHRESSHLHLHCRGEERSLPTPSALVRCPQWKPRPQLLPAICRAPAASPALRGADALRRCLGCRGEKSGEAPGRALAARRRRFRRPRLSGLSCTAFGGPGALQSGRGLKALRVPEEQEEGSLPPGGCLPAETLSPKRPQASHPSKEREGQIIEDYRDVLQRGSHWSGLSGRWRYVGLSQAHHRFFLPQLGRLEKITSAISF